MSKAFKVKVTHVFEIEADSQQDAEQKITNLITLSGPIHSCKGPTTSYQVTDLSTDNLDGFDGSGITELTKPGIDDIA